MNTKPKFSIGQEVWYMCQNEPISGYVVKIVEEAYYAEKADTIGNITTTYKFDEVRICYFITDDEISVVHPDRVFEGAVFATEEELCKAVFSDVFENAKITQ